LLATQRYVLVGSFIAAALITPTPDVINQCLIAIPIVGIYQLGVVAVYMMNRKHRRSAKEAVRPIVSGPVLASTPKLANNFSTLARPLPTTPVMPVPVVTQKMIKPAVSPIASSTSSLSKGKGVSIDGFTHVRPSSLDIPHRSPQYVRPPTPSRHLTPTPRNSMHNPSKSIDGFVFA
jgi:hypothetical protein